MKISMEDSNLKKTLGKMTKKEKLETAVDLMQFIAHECEIVDKICNNPQRAVVMDALFGYINRIKWDHYKDKPFMPVLRWKKGSVEWHVDTEDQVFSEILETNNPKEHDLVGKQVAIRTSFESWCTGFVKSVDDKNGKITLERVRLFKYSSDKATLGDEIKSDPIKFHDFWYIHKLNYENPASISEIIFSLNNDGVAF